MTTFKSFAILSRVLKMVSTGIGKVLAFELSVVGCVLAMGICFFMKADPFFPGKYPPYTIAVVFFCSVAAFILGPVVWTFLSAKNFGFRAVAIKTGFLLGLCSLTAMIVWIVVLKSVVVKLGWMFYIFTFVPVAVLAVLWRMQSKVVPSNLDRTP